MGVLQTFGLTCGLVAKNYWFNLLICFILKQTEKDIRSGAENTQLQEMRQVIQRVILFDQEDKWWRNIGDSGVFFCC